MSHSNRNKVGSATFTQAGDPNSFAIEGVLDFETIPVLLPLIKSRLAALSSITINLGAVSYSNSAGIALLLDIVRQCQKQQKKLKFENLPEDMTSIINMCGLQEIFIAQ